MTIKVALAQGRFPVGDIDGNAIKIIQLAREAVAQGADLILFPELTLTGYPPEDLLFRPSLTPRITKALEMIKAATGELAVVLGYPGWSEGKLYNKAMVIYQGRVIADYSKQHLPNYQVFDDKRYFSPGHETCVFTFKNASFCLTVCEDIWFDAPARRGYEAGAEIHLNINGSPFAIDRLADRHQQVLGVVKQWPMATLYVNHVGGQDELVFDGGSFGVSANGAIDAQLPEFVEQLGLVELSPVNGGWHIRAAPKRPPLTTEQALYEALKMGLADYVNRNGFPGVVLGLSGGIDSALSAVIAVDALGAERVRAIMMPYVHTSEMSLVDARQQAERLGIRYDEAAIAAPVDSLLTTLAPLLDGACNDVTAQNVQSRMRGLLLMAISNHSGAMVLTTGNKSELAVGYATLYGDMCGGYNCLKDVSKLWVYRLARWLNKQRGLIPERIITRPPSAELAPNQLDADSLPPYDILDAIIERYVAQDESLDAIVASGFDADVARRVIELIDRNEYKRRQAPEGVRVTRRGFGRDRRYPITQGWQPGQ